MGEARSVEIPDAAVDAAALAYSEWIDPTGSVEFAIRAALVAARPYLMPTREQIAQALSNATRDLDYRPVSGGTWTLAACTRKLGWGRRRGVA
jgi:hypothetical protein